MSEIKNENQPTWADIEVALATEIVEESKKKSKRWFTAWVVTAAALVASNLAWIIGGIKRQEREDIQRQLKEASLVEHYTNFTDSPYDRMACGNWIAADDGICTWNSTTGITDVTHMLAASVWADPSENKYIGNFKSSDVGLEVKADMLNNLPLILDDTSQKDKKIEESFERIVYDLCSGQGKTRSNKELGLTRESAWKLCILTNGEYPLQSYVNQGGAVNRILEVECTHDKLFENPQDTIDILKKNYGFAGKDFVAALEEMSVDKIKNIQQEILKKIASDDKTDKQLLSLSIVLTADRIATDMLFKDMQYIDIQDAKNTLADVSDVADATKDAAKAAKGYLSPLDEINRYSTQDTSSTASKTPSTSGSGSGGGGTSLPSAVSNVDYGKVAEGETALDKISKSAEKLAKLFKRLWKPFQDAWKKEGKNTIDAAQIAMSGIAKLAKSVGKSLVEVWTNGTGTTMLETMLRIAQNVLKTIGNIASGFADAWNKNNVGTQIIQNIADALVVVMQFVEKIAKDTATWAANLDFYPLLESISNLTATFAPILESIGNVLEWIYKNIVLPMLTWVIEVGLPTVINLVSKVATFLADHQPIVEAFGRLLYTDVYRRAVYI